MIARRLGAYAATTVAVAAMTGQVPVAHGQEADPAASGPPVVEGPPPSAEPVAPDVPTSKRSECAVPSWSGRSGAEAATASQRMLGVDAAHLHATGRGQRVAIIDTGVQPQPRLPRVVPGGDYVSDGDGLQDCDGHGTLVAGLIAGQASDGDDFVGMAPAAELISIRQASIAYEPSDDVEIPEQDQVSPGYGNIDTLARAVVHAVDQGATVINISQVACASSKEELDDHALGAALRLARERDVVVVVAAGNVQGQGPCSAQNPADSPGSASQMDWGSISTFVTPARFSDYVLAVGAVDETGGPTPFSLRGPWVGATAPGTDIVSLSSAPGGGLADTQQTQDGSSPYIGSSFSAAYVAGVAALVREKFPEASAEEVIDRITRTSHHPMAGPNPTVGAGVVDPVAALTDSIDPASSTGSTPYSPPPADPGPDPLPRNLALAGSGVLLFALVAGTAISFALRRNPKAVTTPDGTDDSY